MEQSNARPTKRPRLNGPDGFQVTKLKKSVYKHPPNFVSSFDAPKSSINDLNDKREMPKTCVRLPRECPQNPFTSELPGFDDASLVRQDKEKVSSVRQVDHCERREKPSTAANCAESRSSCAPIVKPPNFASSQSASVRPPTMLRQMPLLKPLRHPKPPSFVLSAPKNASSSTKPLSSILKPSSSHQPSTSKPITLKPLAPPTLTPSFLKKPSTDMKPISSFATDLTKDGAAAELLSLFLQQNGHNFVPQFEREIQRGIGLSPRKSKGGKGRFKSGGLAERTQYLMECSKTDYTLWHRQLEQTLSSASPAAPLPPNDMRFRILRVLPLLTTASAPTSMHLAVCRISSRDKFASVGELTDQCYVVLFPQLPGPSRSFDEGRDVLAWRPWFKVIVDNMVPRETLESLSVEPLMPPRSIIIAPRWHVMQVR